MDLEKAVICDANDRTNPEKTVTCMFNPSEYTISKANEYTPTPNKEEDASFADLSMAGARTLRLNLLFDTYQSGKDVNDKTRPLWELMGRQDNSTEPKQVLFKWSAFEFKAYITNITQQYTMFTHKGIPVRAKVEVNFTEYVKKLEGTNPTSGGGPPDRMWKVVQGDRLDLIAYKVYNDATKWRPIAERNHLSNPLLLRAGQILQIPKE